MCPKILPNEIKKFIINCLVKLKVKKTNAEITAEVLIDADSKGIMSHGLNRLEHYLHDIKRGACKPNATPKIFTETVASATVCGNNGLGFVVSKFCMNLAIKKAQCAGVSLVVAKGSNHFGPNSFYTEMAVNEGLIGLSFTNTSPLMVPTGAKDVCFGTNPISIAAPAKKGDRIVIDFATTAVALGKIEFYRRKKLKIPLGWALDCDGKPTSDPEAAVKARKLMPLGGPESHKGTGLAYMVELFSGLLSGSAYGPHIRSWNPKSTGKPKPANIGHGFIAIDPEQFTPGFQDRLQDLLCFIRNMEPADPKRPMIIPGDIEFKRVKKSLEEGIEYTDSHIKMIKRIVKGLKVKPPKIQNDCS